MSSVTSGPSGSNYPPPSSAAQPDPAHPFYTQLHASTRQTSPQSQRSDRDHGASVGSLSPDGRAASTRNGQGPDVPDDPQLRANLTNMMGFGANGLAGVSNLASILQYASTPPDGASGFAQSREPPDTTQTPSLARRQAEQDKRTKVSRACDECRRKKIRCDAPDETGTPACSSCARTGVRCAFSRQPMKRGPSKGYIKELAERLNSLESQMHLPPHLQGQRQDEIRQVQQAIAAEGGQVPQQYMAQATSPGLQARIGEKRTRDGMPTHGSQAQVQMQPAVAWGAQSASSRQVQAQHAPATPDNSQYRQQSYNRDNAQSSNQPFWRHGATEPTSSQYNLATQADQEATTITNFDWDENVIDEYFRIIHQTFPILPSNKNRLRQRLGDCPASLREAFITALDCLMRTFPTTILPPNAGYSQAIRRAAELLAKYPFDNPSTHTNATNLVYLQTLVLMALECDNHGPATIRGQAGPSRAEWLGRAAGVAGSLEINMISTTSVSVMEGDRDSEERLARRVWWVLFILDRWHASSTADLLKLPENSVVLLPEDQILLGESTYHLARLSFIIGHLAAILTTTKTPSTNVMAPSNPASSLLGLTLAGEIDRFRESVESVWGSLNLVHLSYHHCHLLIKRLNPTTEPTELVGHAVKVATVLNSRLTPVTPLNHQFAALSAMTLCELCDVTKTKQEAMRGIQHLVECLGEGRGLAGKQESEGWDGAIRELVVGKKQRMLAREMSPLQNLADAAAGGAGNASGSGGGGGNIVGTTDGQDFDPTMLTRYGYLTALGQGLFRTK